MRRCLTEPCCGPGGAVALDRVCDRVLLHQWMLRGYAHWYISQFALAPRGAAYA